MVRVLVVDDQRPFLQVAHELLDAAPGFEAVGESESGEEGLAMLEQIEPDLVLADVHMPGLSGIEMARQITARSPHPVVFLVSAQEPSGLARESRRCGAAAILRKQDLTPNRLRELWAEHGPKWLPNQ